MSHKEVYDLFKKYFPLQKNDVIAWFPNGRNSVRVRMKNHKDYVFTYNSKNSIHYETVDDYLERVKWE